MSLAIAVWSILLAIFVGVPTLYYLYMRRFSFKPWNVKRDSRYAPLVTVVVPMHNEEKIIKLKLENLMRIDYPRDKLQIVIVNDGSDDASVPAVLEFQELNPLVKIEFLDNTGGAGKVESLNLALKHARGEVIIVSDADCFWPQDAIGKALQFLSDSSVGAVAGLEVLLNPKETWVTESEILYNDVVHTIRIGESKLHSTIIFQGGFGAYKRSLLDQFDVDADDSGTALNIVQKGVRTLLVPEVMYFTVFPRTFKGKVSTKLRRANNLQRLWFRCLKLSSKGKVALPKRIFMPEAFLHLVNPFVFLFLIPASVLVFAEYFILLLLFLVFLVVAVLVGRLRTPIVEAVQDQLILLGALFSSIVKRRFGLWTSEEASRACLTREALENEGLV